MHDHNFGFLRRTTDIENKFPDKVFNRSADFTWEELQSLNAGDWFMDVSLVQLKPKSENIWYFCWKIARYISLPFQTDPFCSVSSLSEAERQMARNQTIPSLLELLHLARDNSIQVLFDLYSPDTENDTEVVVHTILHSGIDPGLVGLILCLRWNIVQDPTVSSLLDRFCGFLQKNVNMSRVQLRDLSKFTMTAKNSKRTRETTWTWSTV